MMCSMSEHWMQLSTNSFPPLDMTVFGVRLANQILRLVEESMELRFPSNGQGNEKKRAGEGENPRQPV